MSRSTAFGTAFGLALLAALAVGGYLLLEYVGGAFTSLDPPLRTLAAIGSVVVLLSAVIVGEGLKARGARDPQAHASKILCYEGVLAACCEQSQRPRADAQGQPELAETERALSLHGGSRVISAYLNLRRATHDDAAQEIRAGLVKRVIAEMRHDLGSRDLITKESDLLELLIETDGGADGAHRVA